MKKIKTAIIGCGKVADTHARAFMNIPNSEFVAVYGRNKEKAEAFAAKYGIKAIIQPGGSIRDKESIEACDKLGIAMIFTGARHFKH